MKARRLSSVRCLCRNCGPFFNPIHAFDRHRVGVHPSNRRCFSGEEMRDHGLSVNKSGFWITKPHPKGRIEATPIRTSAALRATPLGHQGGVL
jgi:hypothetical protein